MIFLQQDEEEQPTKRDLSSQVACTVYQVVGKDYTEPAFNIEFDVADDRSDPETELCVGTYRRGCDVLRNEPIGGRTSLQSRVMSTMTKLFFCFFLLIFLY